MTVSQRTADALMPWDEVLATYDPAMGLEVHVELGTRPRCSAGARAVRRRAQHARLPDLPRAAGRHARRQPRGVESAIRIGLALNCQIAEWCRFARKNYFYPDMPKNFQTSQYDEPIAFDGYIDVDVDGETFRVEIERAHMEEDTGKSTHMGGATGRIHGADYSLLDYNRAGIPLIEIVTKPITGTGEKAPAVARAYVSQLRDLIIALGVSEARMDQGNLRADVNLSLAPKGSGVLGTRTETKNVNSFRSVERAVRYEMQRHAAVLAAGGSILQETRHWHEDTGVTTTAGRSRTPTTTATSPSPTWCRWPRPASGSRSCAARCRRTRPRGGPGCRPSGASATSRCATHRCRRAALIEETVAAGATPAAARKWWLGELARRANDDGVEMADLADHPGPGGPVQALVDAGPSTTSSPARSSRAVRG